MMVFSDELLRKSSSAPSIPTSTPSSVPKVPPVIPDPIDLQLVGHDGKTTLWVVFVVMVVASALFASMSWSLPVSRRVFHVTTTLLTLVSSLAYFAMATGQGSALHNYTIHHVHDHVPDTYTHVARQFFWAHYVDWALTTPLILLNLSLLSGLSGAHTLMAISANLIMVFSALFSTFGHQGTGQKWGWFAISCVSYLFVIWHVALNMRAQAQAKGSQAFSFFNSIAAYSLIVWTVYPIIWGIAADRKLSVDGEVIAYGILDILAKPVFGVWLLIGYARIAETNLDVGGFWTYGVGREGALRLPEEEGA